MKIGCYCQHVLGIGHFHRSLALCRELASHHDTRLIIGGPPVDTAEVAIPLIQLPGLQMDQDFNNLAPCSPGITLEEVKSRRRQQLFGFFSDFRPDIFLVELYPFGRKAFRFELDPLLKAICEGRFGKCRAYVSLRDILVERVDDREKFEERAVTTLNTYFHGLLIHSDPDLIALEETFGRCDAIRIPRHYTGFIAPKHQGYDRQTMRNRLQLTQDKRLIVVSVGGGNVGSELLAAAIAAYRSLADPTVSMQLFAGPYCPEESYAALQRQAPPGVQIDRFTPHFSDWLQAADLSISMAGYNTCMNLAQAGVPALLYPFAQNREQTLRASRLARLLPFTLIADADLRPQRLASLVAEMLVRPRATNTIDLDGARQTRMYLEKWHDEAQHAR